MAVRDPQFQTYVRRCHLVAGLFTFAALTAFYTVADGHLDRTARNLDADLHRNQTLVLQQPVVDARIAELQSAMETIDKQLVARRLRIPEYPAEHEFSEQLNDLATRAELAVEELRPDQYFHTANIDRMTFRVRVAGEWRGLCGFLNQVTTLERLCHVDQCRVSSDPESPSRLRCDIEVSIFSRSPIPTAALERRSQ
ncbi:MAG: type 4a pilus biogenesis protein PilO [Planctomycetaceae bacterium]|nr:type 4a pilus biogenesis protein PilO [Planctomycetaceae bacterium]